MIPCYQEAEALDAGLGPLLSVPADQWVFVDDGSSDGTGDRLRTAAPTHLRGIAEYFLSAIEGGDLETVERTMKSVSDRACGSRERA